MEQLPYALRKMNEALDMSGASSVSETFPYIEAELIEALEQRFPPRDWPYDAQLGEIKHYCGVRQVIQFLKDVRAAQEEESP